MHLLPEGTGISAFARVLIHRGEQIVLLMAARVLIHGQSKSHSTVYILVNILGVRRLNPCMDPSMALPALNRNILFLPSQCTCPKERTPVQNYYPIGCSLLMPTIATTICCSVRHATSMRSTVINIGVNLSAVSFRNNSTPIKPMSLT